MRLPAVVMLPGYQHDQRQFVLEYVSEKVAYTALLKLAQHQAAVSTLQPCLQEHKLYTGNCMHGVQPSAAAGVLTSSVARAVSVTVTGPRRASQSA